MLRTPAKSSKRIVDGCCRHGLLPSLRRWCKGSPILTLGIETLLLWLSFGVAGQAAEISEYQVKAAFLYNVAKFVEWPAMSAASFHLCIATVDPFADSLEALTGKPVHGLPLKVDRLSSAAIPSDCQMLFVSDDAVDRMKPLLQSVQTMPVLTVSVAEGFAKAGGMLELVNEDNRIKFDINLAAAQKTHLKLSAQMLALARALYNAAD